MNRSAVLVLSFLWLAQAAAAQQTQRDPQAVTVISQSLKAMGSSAAVQDTLAAGTIAMADGRSGTITIKSKGQGRLRHDINLDGKQLTYVVKGGTGYSVKNGKKSDLPLWVTQYQRPEHMPALSRLADYVSPYTKISYVGLEQVAGRAAYHIRLATVPQDGTPIEIEELISEFHVFLDKETLLVVKTQGYLFSPDALQNRSPVETYYSDYRAVAGVLVPFRMTRYISGHKDCDIVFSSVQLNVGIPDSEFE